MSADGRGLVSQAGAVLLWETMRVTGLGRGLSEGLARWRAPRAVHDPGKIVADLAAAMALGGDCLADIAVLREQPALAGPVASDPVVSRLVSTLAQDGPRALKAIRAARAAARERAWALAGDAAPGADGGLVTIDLDATIVIAHSEKEQASPTWKRTFGHHPITAWADHGADGNGEPLAIVLRAGNAGSSTAADHIEATRLSLAQLPRQLRRRVLIRADSAGGTHEFLNWLTAKSRRLHYSVGMTITEAIQAAIGKVPAAAWTPAYDGDGQVRDGAWVADITGLLALDGWPDKMRVIVRKERPHPGAQLRFSQRRLARQQPPRQASDPQHQPGRCRRIRTGPRAAAMSTTRPPWMMSTSPRTASRPGRPLDLVHERPPALRSRRPGRVRRADGPRR